MKKQFAAIALAAVLCTAVFAAGCGGGKEENDSAQTESLQSVQEESEKQASSSEEIPEGQQSFSEEQQIQPVSVDTGFYEMMDKPDKTNLKAGIADWFLFGRYYNVRFDGSSECDKKIFDDIPDMTFHTGETRHVLSREVSSVPVSMVCERATSLHSDTVWLHTRADWAELYGKLKAEHPDTADELLKNILELYNTPVADMALIGEDGSVYSHFLYIYAMDGDVMTCRQIRGLTDEFMPDYYEDTDVQTFTVRFDADTLVMENTEGGTVTLLPQQKWKTARGESRTYNLTGAIMKDEDAFMDIIDVSLNWNNTEGATNGLPVLHFLDGTQTDLYAEAFLTGENEVTVNWNNIIEPDGTVVGGPGSVTFRYINGGGMMEPGLVILDEEGNAYPYLGWYDDYLTNKAAG